MTRSVANPIDILRNAARPAFHAAIRFNLSRNKSKYRYVFVLAHMRSGSTVLSHILASNPEFVQAGESYITYKTTADLEELAFRTCQRLRKIKLSATYIVDKIVYDGYVADEILQSLSIEKCIIQIRSPESALKSMMDHYDWTEARALEVYAKRLDSLARHGAVLRQRAMLIEYDDLVEQPDNVLAAMSNFFGVAKPFTASYKTHRMTGLKVGDTSRNIWAGEIIKTQGHEIEISSSILAKASLAFQSCQERLLNAGVRKAK